MKLVVHVGLPKCGSTSIQNSLFENSQAISTHGVLYKPGESNFRSHYKLAAQSRSIASHDAFESQLNALVDSAIASAADVLVISSEEFIYSAENDGLAKLFFDIFRRIIFAKGVDLEFVIILRDPRKFMRSYMLQKVANGDVIVDPGLPHFFEFFIKILRRFIAAGWPVAILSLDQLALEAGLIKTFYSEILDLPSIEVSERMDNVLAKRTFVTESITGQICSMTAHMAANHVNSPQVDTVRERIREYIDVSAEDANIGIFLDRLEAEYLGIFNRIIESAVEHTSGEDWGFWSDLNSRPVSRFHNPA